MAATETLRFAWALRLARALGQHLMPQLGHAAGYQADAR
jgi:hypothetical protein